MNKIKLIISNCRCEINSLLDRIKGKEITHIIITNSGNKIKCIDSIEMYEGETKIIVATCLINMKKKIVTIESDNIEYILEDFNDNTWDMLINLPVAEKTVENDGLYYFG